MEHSYIFINLDCQWSTSNGLVIHQVVLSSCLLDTATPFVHEDAFVELEVEDSAVVHVGLLFLQLPEHRSLVDRHVQSVRTAIHQLHILVHIQPNLSKVIKVVTFFGKCGLILQVYFYVCFISDIL